MCFHFSHTAKIFPGSCLQLRAGREVSWWRGETRGRDMLFEPLWEEKKKKHKDAFDQFFMTTML